MTTTAQIRAETGGDRGRRAEPRPQEAISGPRDRLPDPSDPQNCSAQPLDFHRSPEGGLRARRASRRVCLCKALGYSMSTSLAPQLQLFGLDAESGLSDGMESD